MQAMHQAMVSLQEKLEVADWYQQRADACGNDARKAIPPQNMRSEDAQGNLCHFKEGDAMTDKPFLSDIQTLRARARQHIAQGAVTPGYRADRETVVRLLNEALATEIVCVLRYKRHFFMASGINAQSVAAEFLQHATEEQAHADQIAQRIVQLGGAPNWSPEGLLSRSHSEYVEGTSLTEMITEDLVAERIAIDSYREMITYLGTDDPTTRRMMETILAMEEEHADDLVSLLEEFGS
jgi:bacterioferritin